MSSSNQEILVDYLENGGNLYLEGSDVASSLEGTELLFLLGAAAESIGNPGDEVSSIVGFDGTFAAGINIEYDGGTDSHYKVDHLQPVIGQSFIKCEEDIVRGVSRNDAGFKSITTSTIIGAYKDGEGLNLRNYLMGQYLNFFEGTETANDDEILEINSLNLQNYPNPFVVKNTRNNDLTIEFSIEESSNVNIEIFNIKGQRVITLCNEVFDKGINSVRWNGKNSSRDLVNSGVYFFKVDDGKHTSTKKILLIKD